MPVCNYNVHAIAHVVVDLPRFYRAEKRAYFRYFIIMYVHIITYHTRNANPMLLDRGEINTMSTTRVNAYYNNIIIISNEALLTGRVLF